MKNPITVVVAMVIAVVGGWYWGASGRWTAEKSLQTIELRQDLTEGRSALLETRLDIYSVNFGDASTHLEAARASLQRALDHLAKRDRVDDVTAIQAALAGVDDAQRMAGKLDQNANTRAAEVAAIVASVLGGGVQPAAK